MSTLKLLNASLMLPMLVVYVFFTIKPNDELSYVTIANKIWRGDFSISSLPCNSRRGGSTQLSLSLGLIKSGFSSLSTFFLLSHSFKPFFCASFYNSIFLFTLG